MDSVFHQFIRILTYVPTFAEAEADVEAKTIRFGWRYHDETVDDESHWLKYTT